MSNSKEIYDVNPEEAEIIKWRAQRRLALRNQYLKEIHNPNSKVQGHLFDDQIHRLYALHQTKEYFFKANLSAWLRGGAIIGSIFGLFYIVNNDRKQKERMYRTGQVSYRARDWKFA